MAGEYVSLYLGGITLCPETTVMMGSSMRAMDMMSSNFHHQITSKAEYKGYGGGSSRKDAKTFKSSGFIDGRNGNRVYKKEVDYGSSVKVTDDRLGITTHYETQVKHKKTTTYANPSSRSGGGKSSSKTGYTVAKPNKCSGGERSCCKTGYAVAKSNKSSGEVRIKMAAGTSTKYTSKGSGSGGSKCKIVAKYSSSSKTSGRRK